MIDRFYELRKADFGFLERLELRQSVDPREWSGFQIEMDLRANASTTSPRLLLMFEGVKSLRIGDLQGLLRYMVEIHSIAGSQLEGANYQVDESEYKAISFTCSTFTAQVQ